jgi:hypothetical protein
MTRRRHDHRQPQSQTGALALAIERGDWERASLLLLIAVARVARATPPGTIDDVLAFLSDREEDGDAEIRS